MSSSIDRSDAGTKERSDGLGCSYRLTRMDVFSCIQFLSCRTNIRDHVRYPPIRPAHLLLSPWCCFPFVQYRLLLFLSICPACINALEGLVADVPSPLDQDPDQRESVTPSAKRAFTYSLIGPAFHTSDRAFNPCLAWGWDMSIGGFGSPLFD